MVKIYGIKNCDTMKKAMIWLNDHGVAYDFIDYKKAGADAEVLRAAIAQHGWDNVINRRGTTWRQLPDAVKAQMDDEAAISAAMENPSLVKRPLLINDAHITLGFKPEIYAALFGKA